MATQTTYRRTVAPLLGPYHQFTATSGGSHANTTSRLEITSLSNNGLSFKSNVNSPSTFEDKWMHRPAAVAAADADRTVDTYTPGSGYASPENNWTNAPTGEVVEFHPLFSGTELNALVNLALKNVFVLREFTFTVSHANIRRHNLAATATWLKDWRWVYQVGHLQSGESRVGTSTIQHTDPFSRPVGGKAYNRPGQVWIEGPSWRTTDTVYVLAACPAYDACRVTSAGTFGDVSGLAGEAYEAPVDDTWLAWRIILEAADRLDSLAATGQATADALRSRAIAAARFSALTEAYWSEPERTFRAQEWLGPTADDSWNAGALVGVA